MFDTMKYVAVIWVLATIFNSFDDDKKTDVDKDKSSLSISITSNGEEIYSLKSEEEKPKEEVIAEEEQLNERPALNDSSPPNGLQTDSEGSFGESDNGLH